MSGAPEIAGLSESARAAHEVLSLPIFPELDAKSIAREIEAIRKTL